MPSPYSPSDLYWVKAVFSRRHSGWPRQAFAYCEVFATAAPRRAWALVSVPISGLPLPRPVPVIGLVSRYLTNNLIGRGPILGQRLEACPKRLLGEDSFQRSSPIGNWPQFPGDVSVLRVGWPRVIELCAAPLAWLRGARLACLSPIPIAVGSGRINRSCSLLIAARLLCLAVLAAISTGFGGESTILSSKPISDLTCAFVRSSFLSPQLEANRFILWALRLLWSGLSRRRLIAEASLSLN